MILNVAANHKKNHNFSLTNLTFCAILVGVNLGGNSRFLLSMPNSIAQIGALLKRSPVEIFALATVVALLGYVLIPLAFGFVAPVSAEDRAVALSVASMQNKTVPYGQLPKAKLTGPFSIKVVTASAYNSVPWQTDSTPFTTASGTTVRHGVLAANFLPIGTQVTIPDLYGDQIFVVEDRMNARYRNNIDIWMESVTDARKFGRRSVTINVYPSL